MRRHESRFVYATVGVFLLVSIVSGPVVQGVDFSVDRPELGYTPDENLGDGNVNVTIVHIPERVRLVRGDYGDETYQIQVSPAVVDIHQVRGNPILTYKIRILELDFNRITPHFLNPSDTGRMELSIKNNQYPPDRIDRNEYTARLRVLKRENGTVTMLRNVTVPVDIIG